MQVNLTHNDVYFLKTFFGGVSITELIKFIEDLRELGYISDFEYKTLKSMADLRGTPELLQRIYSALSNTGVNHPVITETKYKILYVEDNEWMVSDGYYKSTEEFAKYNDKSMEPIQVILQSQKEFTVPLTNQES